MPQNPPGQPAQWRNFYGRHRGKRLRESQKTYLEVDLPRLIPSGLSPDENPERRPVDLDEVFGKRGPVWLEVGFGAGEHLVDLARRHRSVGMIGCEPYINGVASLLSKLRKSPLSNVRIYPGDVRDLFDVLPNASLQRAYVLYPDPWPKKRHHRRRFVTSEFLEPLARVMADGALVHMATDVSDYARQAIEQVNSDMGFEWTAECCRDWREPWEGWCPTRYEQKAVLGGQSPIYLVFCRRRRAIVT